LLVLISGTLLFIPGAIAKSYYIFLVALFVIACGFSFFEIIANPYATFLGNKHAATRRINLAQAFNGIGWIFGPFLGGLIIFNNSTGEYRFNNLPIPFAILGIGVLCILFLIIKKPLPELSEIHKDYEEKLENGTSIQKPFYKYPHFILAIIAQFFYVAGQTGVNSFFINYVTETNISISDKEASLLLAFGGMGLFVAGRFLGSYFMKFISPEKLLSLFSVACVALTALVIFEINYVSLIALCALYFFMSIMYPTIFALGIKDLGNQVKKASSYIVMGIIGGAVCPMFMGMIADTYSMSIGFIVPLICFAFVLFYGVKGAKIR
jgi:FHS family L-fucose permease-like MFS transporter